MIVLMPIFIRGIIKIVENASFINAQTKEKVPYYVHYVQDPEGKLQKLASQIDYSDFLDEIVIITATLKPDFNKPNLFKVIISDVKKDK